MKYINLDQILCGSKVNYAFGVEIEIILNKLQPRASKFADISQNFRFLAFKMLLRDLVMENKNEIMCYICDIKSKVATGRQKYGESGGGDSL